MNRGNFFRRCFIALIGMIFALNAAVAHAEIYTGEGSYVMSEGENLGVSKERAKADAMRNATEKAGVYVKSYSRSKNFELEEDIIETMTANILKLVENPHFDMPEKVNNLEGILIHVIVKVQIDDSDITRWLNKSEQEKSTLVSQMEALRKAYDEQARGNEEGGKRPCRKGARQRHSAGRGAPRSGQVHRQCIHRTRSGHHQP